MGSLGVVGTSSSSRRCKGSPALGCQQDRCGSQSQRCEREQVCSLSPDDSAASNLSFARSQGGVSKGGVLRGTRHGAGDAPLLRAHFLHVAFHFLPVRSHPPEGWTHPLVTGGNWGGRQPSVSRTFLILVDNWTNYYNRFIMPFFNKQSLLLPLFTAGVDDRALSDPTSSPTPPP